MTVGAVVSTPTESFPLASLFEADADARVTLERCVPLGRTVPFVWVTGVDVERIRQVAADSAAVRSVAVRQSNGGSLVAVDWATTDCVLELLAQTDVACLRGVGTAAGWRFHLRFPDRETLAACYRTCGERGLDLRVEAVRSPSTAGPWEPDDALTPGQREALVAALDAGYFGVPRGATLQEVAAVLDISDTAASQRLRRGVERLLREVFLRED